MKRIIKGVLRRLASLLVRSSNLVDLVEVEIEEKKMKQLKKAWNDNLTSYSDFFSLESSVLNLSNDPKLIQLGHHAYIRGHLRVLRYGGKLEIGNYVYVGKGSQIWSGDGIRIGDDTLISDYVFISDTNSHEIDALERSTSYRRMLIEGAVTSQGSIKTDKISIGNNVWIGYGCIILKGVNIGDEAIIGAGSVVVSNCEGKSFYAGNPAKLIKRLG